MKYHTNTTNWYNSFINSGFPDEYGSSIRITVRTYFGALPHVGYLLILRRSDILRIIVRLGFNLTKLRHNRNSLTSVHSCCLYVKKEF